MKLQGQNTSRLIHLCILLCFKRQGVFLPVLDFLGCLKPLPCRIPTSSEMTRTFKKVTIANIIMQPNILESLRKATCCFSRHLLVGQFPQRQDRLCRASFLPIQKLNPGTHLVSELSKSHVKIKSVQFENF